MAKWAETGKWTDERIGEAEEVNFGIQEKRVRHDVNTALKTTAADK